MTRIDKENMAQKNSTQASRYWGWGDTKTRYDPKKRDRFLIALERRYGLIRREKEPIAELAKFKVPHSELPKAFVKKWSKRGLSLKPEDRIRHAAGKSYRDLLRMRSASIQRLPDGVLRLHREEDLATLFRDAGQFKITLIPFGGGTGVVGGTECVGSLNRPVLVVDVKALNRLIDLDPISMTAKFEAGILGPDLEKALNAKGFTLGHFPQSFEFSTLGGWIATRSAGQNSTKYGKIEDMVQSLCIWTPHGIIKTPPVPASASGPSIKDILIGSEGLYGIITDATIKIHHMPEREAFAAILFPSFDQGMACLREMMQQGLKPSIVRLHDERESELFAEISQGPLEKLLASLWLGWKRLGPAPCLFIVASDGERAEVSEEQSRIKSFVRKYGGQVAKTSFEKKWQHDRFRMPYLRDDLMDHGFFIDTMETAAAWSQIKIILKRVRYAFASDKEAESLFIGSHISHAYADGASLYFTFIGRQKKGDEIGQWEGIKCRATAAILAGGGTISHHHGIGYDHRRWMPQEHSDLGLEMLRSIKTRLDPEGLLNPGKVFDKEFK